MESDGIPILSQTRCGGPSMSELYFNSASPFTRWTVANALLREKFVVVDVGCQGGVHVQWDLLGEYADVHALVLAVAVRNVSFWG
jgi:hypothetical protein